ncbi:hypothetical protein [Undibacterium luofuense]|uniref:Uncharacterized protein n=1 Tax=Undibacterium luofuense TaxID=2828733 RepID=A0A941DQ16_9BURK|nr:hypothetical protein [Undibacterium luofuense]MBR7783845.1 hypothetical protein [Undibacterium luofuense]
MSGKFSSAVALNCAEISISNFLSPGLSADDRQIIVLNTAFDRNSGKKHICQSKSGILPALALMKIRWQGKICADNEASRYIDDMLVSVCRSLN